MKRNVIFLLFLMSLACINGQDQELNKFQKKNAILVEFGGTGGFYSLNYERFIFNQELFKTSLQFGAGYTPYTHGDIWIPIGINELYSINNNHIEIGIGYVPVRESVLDEYYHVVGKRWIDVLSGRIGYRYQKKDGRLIFRISFTPLLLRERISRLNYNPYAPFNVFNPWGGISIGYSW